MDINTQQTLDDNMNGMIFYPVSELDLEINRVMFLDIFRSEQINKDLNDYFDEILLLLVK